MPWARNRSSRASRAVLIGSQGPPRSCLPRGTLLESRLAAPSCGYPPPHRGLAHTIFTRTLTESSRVVPAAREASWRRTDLTFTSRGRALSEVPQRPIAQRLTRRALLRHGGTHGAALGAPPASMPSPGSLWRAAAAAGAIVRRPDSLPDPRRPAGTVTEKLP